MDSKKLLCINVFYSPQSFGGATILAEETNIILAKKYNWEIVVVTSFKDPDLLPYHIKRYNAKSVEVIAINLPDKIDYEGKYSNKKVGEITYNIAKRFNPDYVHIHSIQTLGAELINAVSNLGLKTILTLHDCWWICERQFMINDSGKYCFQDKIDPNVCLYCVVSHDEFETRQIFLKSIMDKVDLFLYPSDFHRLKHINNDFPEAKSRTNKNGVILPKKEYRKTIGEKIRFGFTGGPGTIKGFDIILEVFSQLDPNTFELIIVDAAKNLGKSWSNAFKTKVPLTIRPPYNMETIDSFFQDIDVLLFPSQWKESFGLTVREALVRDVWVLSTDGGGTTEDLIDCVNSTIIPMSSDPKHLKNAVEQLITKNFSGYTNQHKDEITSYEDQVTNYLSILKEYFGENND